MNRAVAGIGLGLRAPLAEALLRESPRAVRWLEVSPENYVGRAGGFVRHLDAALERWPVVTHGLTLGVADVAPFDEAYLSRLRAFLGRVGTPWHSEHLCFGSYQGAFLHDLLPVPFTDENAEHVAARARAIQARMPVRFALENLSWYAHPGPAQYDEAEFLTRVLEAADVGLLLDVNNVYVNARNEGFDPRAFLDRLPLGRVVQIHVAGHLVRPDGLRVDTHGEPVCDDVYALLEHTLRRTGPVPVLLERDNHIPAFEELVAELDRLDAIYARATGGVP